MKRIDSGSAPVHGVVGVVLVGPCEAQLIHNHLLCCLSCRTMQFQSVHTGGSTIQVYSIVHEYYYIHFSNLVIGGLDRRVIIMKNSRDCGSPGSHVHACG